MKDAVSRMRVSCMVVVRRLSRLFIPLHQGSEAGLTCVVVPERHDCVMIALQP